MSIVEMHESRIDKIVGKEYHIKLSEIKMTVSGRTVCGKAARTGLWGAGR